MIQCSEMQNIVYLSLTLNYGCVEAAYENDLVWLAAWFCLIATVLFCDELYYFSAKAIAYIPKKLQCHCFHDKVHIWLAMYWKIEPIYKKYDSAI